MSAIPTGSLIENSEVKSVKIVMLIVTIGEAEDTTVHSEATPRR